MEFIAHRINTLQQLKDLPKECGVEIDLRDSGNRIILQHDPFTEGEEFELFLKEYQHGTMILNIKSERIEYRVLQLLTQYNIKKYFFLDSSFPMMYLLSQNGENNIAARFSEYEGVDTIMAMTGRIEWVWVDCFTRFPLDKQSYKQLKEAGFKLCLVSPELQGRPEDIVDYKQKMIEDSLIFDAICTKHHNIEIWTL